MRGQEGNDAGLTTFIDARSHELYRDAYLLTGSQKSAERLVAGVLAGMQRDRVDLSRAGATTWLRMARAAAHDDVPPAATDAGPPARFRPIARLSSRQRAALALQVMAGYDERAIARALHLPPRTTSEILASIPYDELTGGTLRLDELRSLLEDFGDQAIVPTAASTLDDLHAVPPPPRRPWWTYVAALVVVALTVSCLVVAQRWHDDWLHTPDGLNDAHGTHFPIWTQGYRLVDIRDVEPGIAQDVTLGSAGAVALPCDTAEARVHLTVLSDLSGNYLSYSCTRSFIRPTLTPFTGKASASVVGGNRATYPVAVYRKVPRSKYPVAVADFEVQQDLSFAAVRRQAAGGERPPAAGKRQALTLHGTAAHPNGTFTGRLRLPPSADDLGALPLHTVALLSPTTTGTFTVRIQGLAPMTGCGELPPLTDDTLARPEECSLVDRRVPQITYLQDTPPVDDWVPVRITVKDARGPWTLQVVADFYEFGADSHD